MMRDELDPRDIEHSALAKAIEQLREDNVELRAAVKEQGELVQEMVDLFQAAKGAFKVLGWIGTGVKWVSAVAAAGVALWYMIKNGFPPPK